MFYTKNIPYYLSASVIFILLKFLFSHMSSDELLFLLQPTNYIVEVMSNTESQYVSQQGFYNNRLNILINKSCSGFNFLLMCYLMLIFLIVGKLKNRLHKTISLPILLLLSYLLTLFSNSSRIMMSIMVRDIRLEFSIINTSWLHQLQGSFVYLFFLIIIYLMIENFFNPTNSTKTR